MYRKLLTVLVSAALTFSGLAASPASATSYAPNSGSNISATRWGTNFSSNTAQFSVPVSGVQSLRLDYRWRFEGLKVSDIINKKVVVNYTFTKPDGSIINSENSMNSGFSGSAFGSISSLDQGYRDVQQTPGSRELDFTSTASSFNWVGVVFYGNLYSVSGDSLPVGNYSLSLSVLINGEEYQGFAATRDNENPDQAYIEAASVRIETPYEVTTTRSVAFNSYPTQEIANMTCIDTSRVAEGDVITVRHLTDGVETPQDSLNLLDRDISSSRLSNDYYVGLDNNNQLTLTADHISSGLLIRSSYQYRDSSDTSNPFVNSTNSISSGTHEFGLSVTNQNGTEVSTACTPPAPSGTISTPQYSNGQVTVSQTGTFKAQTEYTCQAFNATTNQAVGRRGYPQTLNYTDGSTFTLLDCRMYDIPAGQTIYVKFASQFRYFSGWAGYGPASANLTLPSEGLNFTSTASNGSNHGDIKAIADFDAATVLGAGTTVSSSAIADPTGGLFEFSIRYGRGAGNDHLTIRRITAAGIDSTFGSVAYASPYSGTISVGRHGSQLDPYPVVIAGNPQTGAVEIQNYSKSGLERSKRQLAATDLTNVCKSANGFNSSSWSYGNMISLVSTATSDLYFQIACRNTTANPPTSGFVLAKINMSTTAAPTAVTNLGVPTSTRPEFVSLYTSAGPGMAPASTNFFATGTANMLTFVTTPLLRSTSSPFTETYGTPLITRVNASGAVTKTSSGITVPSSPVQVQMGESFNLGLIQTNFGTAVLVLSSRLQDPNEQTGYKVTQSTLKLGATGTPTALTTIFDDTTPPMANSRFSAPLGVTASGELVFLRATFTGTMSGITRTFRMAKLNLTSGAVTTFGELLSYDMSPRISEYLVELPGLGFAVGGPSASSPGKISMRIGMGVSTETPVTPTVPVPTGDVNTNLGKGLNAGGTKIVISGSLLTAVTAVTFNGVLIPAKNFAKTATTVTITVPSGITGVAAVALVHAGGSIPVGNFEYMGATKRAQTLIPSGLGDPTHSGASEADRNFTVASSLNGYSVTVVSKTPTICTYVSGVIDFIGNGTCILQASQAGDTVTNAASATYEIYYETTVVPSTLYSTDAGRPTITITGEGLTSVSKVVFGTVEVTPTKKTATSIKVTVPTAPTTGANVDLSLKYTNGTVVDTQLDFDFVGTAKLNQTVALVAGFSTATYGDAARTLTASSVITGTSDALENLPYVFSSTTTAVCAVTGNQLRFLTAGTCTVRATQAGNAGVNVAAPVTFNITVSKKTQLISVIETAREITDVAGVNLDAENSNSEVLLDYVSTNESVCTVDGEGFVTGLGQGTCTVTIDAAGDARYDAAPQKSITVNVSVDNATVVPESEAEIVEATPVAVSPGGVNSFISLADPSLQVSWDKATGKLTPRATGVYTGFITAEVRFTVAGTLRTCTTVFGSNAALKVPTKPVLAANPTARQTATYNKALASYNKAFKAAWESKIFKSASVCADGSKLTGTSFATLKRVAKTSAERRVEAANYKLLKNFTGDVTITVKRWRAWPTTAKNKKGNPLTGKIIPAVTNKYTLTLG